MLKPLSRILVIEDEPLVLREIVKGLNAAARSLDNPLGIAFSGVATAKEALAAIEADGDMQAVLGTDVTAPQNTPNPGPNAHNLYATEWFIGWKPEIHGLRFTRDQVVRFDDAYVES